MIRVNAKLLAAVAVAKRNDLKKRMELNGVHIVNHMLVGVLIIATNGEIITVAHDPDGTTDSPGETYPVSDKVIAAIRKMKDDGVVIFEHNQISVVGSINDGVFYEEPAMRVPAPFPPWQSVIPDFSKDSQETSISYSAYVFKKIIDTAMVFGSDTMFVAYAYDDDIVSERVLIRYCDDDYVNNIFSIVMPAVIDVRPSAEIPFMIL